MKSFFGGQRSLRLAALAFILAGLALLLPLWGLASAQVEGDAASEGQAAPPSATVGLDASPGSSAANSGSSAAGSPASSRWTVAPAAPRVGDPITLTLRLEHGPDQHLVLPRLPRQWGLLELVEQGSPRPLPEGEAPGSEVLLRARAFVTGSLATPPLTLRLVDAAGSSQSVEAPSAVVQVEAVLRSAAELPRDLRPQAPLPPRRPWTKGLALAAAALGLVLALSGARGIRPVPPPPPPPPPPGPPDPAAPWRQALAELDQLDALGLVAAGRARAHYTLAIDILRRYLDQRWGLPALDQTSAELLAQLSLLGRPPAAAAYLGPLLREADLVKFARLDPDPARAGGLTDRIRELLGFWEGRS